MSTSIWSLLNAMFPYNWRPRMSLVPLTFYTKYSSSVGMGFQWDFPWALRTLLHTHKKIRIIGFQAFIPSNPKSYLFFVFKPIYCYDIKLQAVYWQQNRERNKISFDFTPFTFSLEKWLTKNRIPCTSVLGNSHFSCTLIHVKPYVKNI